MNRPLKPKNLVDQIKSNSIQRRHIRYKLYMIKKNRNQDSDGLKEFIEAQFIPGQSWDTFTFNWDIAVTDPFKVISIEDWAKNGGKFDEMGRRSPPAFTCQE